MRAGRLYLLAGLAIALASATIAMLPGSSTAAGSCPDYLFIGARGSGQAYHPSAAGDRGVGSTVYSFYQHLTDDFSGTGLDIELDPVPEPPYEAHSVASKVTDAAAFFHLPGSYEDSVRTIEPWVTNEVATRLSACPGTKVVLSGYSQGAQGVADALQRDINPSVVVGAAFFGDPYFNPRSPGDRGSFDPNRIGILGVRPQYGGALAHKVFSYCRDKDPICQGFIRYTTFSHITSWDTSQHEKYPKAGDPHETDTEMAADNVAALIRADQGADGHPIDEPTPHSLSGPLDVVFAIDTTGSMGGIIDSVKQNVAEIAAQLQGDDPDFRVALVDYKDAPPYSTDPYQAEVDQGFTTDLGEFDTAVQALFADGGGDTPESVYTGMMTALGLPWRAGAYKEMIVIGDAGGHFEDPITGYTAADVVAKSLSLDPVAVNGVPASGEAEATFGSVAEETGGTVVPVEGEAAEAIVQSLQATQTSPVAGLGEETYEGFADSPLALSAAASYSPMGRPLTYEWDFDNDGTIDETTTSPIIEHVFAGGYEGLVTVKVTDDKGQSAVAQANVKAEGIAPPPPGIPGTPALTPGNESVIATWSAPSSGGQVDVYELTDAMGAPEAIVPAMGGGIQRTTIDGLPNGEPVQLSVTAINGGGSTSGGLSEPVSPEPVPVVQGSPPPPTSSATGAGQVAQAAAKHRCLKRKGRTKPGHAACVKKHRHRHHHRHHRSKKPGS
jgi:hypothetical protein